MGYPALNTGIRGPAFSKPDPATSRQAADEWIAQHPLALTRKGRRQVRRAFATIREDVALTAKLKRIETVEAKRGGRYELRRWNNAFSHDFRVPGFNPGLPKARRREYERAVDAERRETLAGLQGRRSALAA